MRLSAPAGTITTSPAAVGSVEPASASASMRRMSPDSAYAPGLRTSPTMNTFWLLYCSMETLIWGSLKIPVLNQLRLQLRLDFAQRQSARADAPEQREGEGQIGFHRELAAEGRDRPAR